MLNIKNLETFIVTAELGSFTRAADRLGYSQSTVSFQIKQLEEELGTPLFILTEKGMSYRRIMDEELARNSLEIIPFLETGDTSLICRLVEQNMGLSFLPDYVTERSVKEGLVSHIDVSDFAIDTWVQLFYHRDKWCTPEMQCLIDYLDAAVSRLGEKV